MPQESTSKALFCEQTREELYEAMAEIEAEKAEQVFNVVDPTVMKVLRNFEARHKAGMRTYGVTLHENSSDMQFWLTMAMEEAMDLTLYLQRALEEIDRQAVGVVK